MYRISGMNKYIPYAFITLSTMEAYKVPYTITLTLAESVTLHTTDNKMHCHMHKD